MQNKYPSILPRVLLFIALRNLVHKKMRTTLTIFGIIIGVGAIFFLLSFGIGLQRLVTSQVVGNQSIKSIDVTTSNSKIVRLNQAVYDKLRDLPHIKRIGASYSYAGNLEANNSSIDTIVYGVDQNYLEMSNLVLSAGRLTNTNDKYAIVINEAAARTIGIKDTAKAVGKNIKLNIPQSTSAGKARTLTFKVVGVSDDNEGNEVYIPASIAVAGGTKDYSQVKIEAETSGDVRSLRTQIATLGLQTASPIDTVDQINQVFKFFNIILVGFGAIGMVVAVLGMFNTLTISLLERTKEIGLMFALGGREKDMRKLFKAEAVLLSVIGATVGILSAIVFGQIVNLVMNLFAHHRGVTQGFQLFAIPWWLVLGSIAFMVIIGLLVVYIPSRRASRINPIDALRRE